MIRILGMFVGGNFRDFGFHSFVLGGGRQIWRQCSYSDCSGGTRLLNPSPFGTILVAAALFAAMLVVLGRLKIWGAFVPRWIFYSGTWVISLLFLLRTIGDFRLCRFFQKRYRYKLCILGHNFIFAALSVHQYCCLSDKLL